MPRFQKQQRSTPPFLISLELSKQTQRNQRVMRSLRNWHDHYSGTICLQRVTWTSITSKQDDLSHDLEAPMFQWWGGGMFLGIPHVATARCSFRLDIKYPSPPLYHLCLGTRDYPSLHAKQARDHVILFHLQCFIQFMLISRMCKNLHSTAVLIESSFLM